MSFNNMTVLAQDAVLDLRETPDAPTIDIILSSQMENFISMAGVLAALIWIVYGLWNGAKPGRGGFIQGLGGGWKIVIAIIAILASIRFNFTIQIFNLLLVGGNWILGTVLSMFS